MAFIAFPPLPPAAHASRMHTAEPQSTSAVMPPSLPLQRSTCDVSGAATRPALLSACPSSVDCSSFQGMFDCILLSLQEASWPSHSRRSEVISATSSWSGYFNFGVQLSRKSCLTQVTRELPGVCRDLNALYPPSFPHRTMEHHLCITGLP